MERSKGALIFLLIFTCLINLKASYSSDIYYYYDYNKMKEWKNLIDQIDAIKNKDNSLILELVNYQYGYIGWCIGNKHIDEAEKYLDLAEKNLELLEAEQYNLSMVNAYKAAFYGFRIGLNTWLAPFVGNKSFDCAKLAIELDATNPYGFIQYANVQFYMPSIFGGSKEDALKHYLKAKELMEKSPGFISRDWNYISLLTTIGKVYWAMNDLVTTKKYFEEIMGITSQYDWVKKEMYPQLLKELDSKK
jgi:hypothetical protein